MEPLFLFIGTTELLLVLPILAILLFGLFHVLTNDKIPGWHRLIWCLVILSVPLIGVIAYWVVGRQPSKAV